MGAASMVIMEDTAAGKTGGVTRWQGDYMVVQ